MKKQIPHADEGQNCPFNGQDTSTVCHKCPLWIQVRGKDPQSDNEVDHWACSFAWMPMLLIENSQMQRQTGASVDSFRNEMVKSNQATLMLFENKNLLQR
jgi:hypothetical protein